MQYYKNYQWCTCSNKSNTFEYIYIYNIYILSWLKRNSSIFYCFLIISKVFLQEQASFGNNSLMKLVRQAFLKQIANPVTLVGSGSIIFFIKPVLWKKTLKIRTDLSLLTFNFLCHICLWKLRIAPQLNPVLRFPHLLSSVLAVQPGFLDFVFNASFNAHHRKWLLWNAMSSRSPWIRTSYRGTILLLRSAASQHEEPLLLVNSRTMQYDRSFVCICVKLWSSLTSQVFTHLQSLSNLMRFFHKNLLSYLGELCWLSLCLEGPHSVVCWDISLLYLNSSRVEGGCVK